MDFLVRAVLECGQKENENLAGPFICRVIYTFICVLHNMGHTLKIALSVIHCNLELVSKKQDGLKKLMIIIRTRARLNAKLASVLARLSSFHKTK